MSTTPLPRRWSIRGVMPVFSAVFQQGMRQRLDVDVWMSKTWSAGRYTKFCPAAGPASLSEQKKWMIG